MLFASFVSISQTNLELLKGFDEAEVIKSARNKGIPETDVKGYVSSRKSDYIHKNAVAREGGEEKLRKKLTFLTLTKDSMDRVSALYCPNIDFQLNDYSNWTGECTTTLSGGAQYPTATWAALGINNNGGSPVFLNTNPYSLSATAATDFQVIMNMPTLANTTVQANAFNNGFDPVCQNPVTLYYDLPVIPPGGTHSLRLGSEYALYTSEEIVYAFNINANNPLFIYQYAIVLNRSPMEITGRQPAFVFQLLNSSNQQIGCPNCLFFKEAVGVASDTAFLQSISSNATVFNGDPVYYCKWHTDTINLTPFIGQTVYASFQALDCIFSGHFGYAYISAKCASSNASGIKEILKVLDVQVFPNPASESLTLRINSKEGQLDNCELKIFNSFGIPLQGVTLPVISPHLNCTIDISDLAAGLYFYTISQTGNPLIQGKFIKE